MQNFHDTYLPKFLTHYIQGGPSFSTLIEESCNGFEYRKAQRHVSKNIYKISGCILSYTQHAELLAFFYARGGRSHSFKMHDIFDDKAKRQKIAIGDGVSTEFKFIKIYQDSVNPYIREIKLPRQETVKIFIDNTITKAEIDQDASTIKLNSPLPTGSVLIVDYEFDVKVRFDTDNLNFFVNNDGSLALEPIFIKEVL